MTATITVEINSKDFRIFEELCKKSGMTVQEAIQHFVIKCLDVGGIPFNMDEANRKKKN